jgi:DNA-binding transcriptional LysR family regulator
LEDQLVIITPVNHPLTKKSQLKANDLNGQFIIMHEQGSAPRRVIEDYVRKNKISVKIPLEMSSNRAIKRAVVEGIGIALISRKVANEQIQAGQLKAIPLSDPSMNRKFYMVHHKDKYISESLQSFMDMVIEWAHAYAQDLP